MVTNTQRQEAEVLRIALLCSCSEREEIVVWADKAIASEENENPDYEFIQLSTSNSWHMHILDVASKLSELSAGSDYYSALRTVLGRMYELASKDRQKLRIFAEVLTLIAIENIDDFPEDLRFCYRLEDDYYSACAGYGTLNEVEEEFMNALRTHWSEQSAASDWYCAALHLYSEP